MSGVEPIACPSCHRKYSPRMEACPYCKTARPAGIPVPPSSTPGSGTMRASAPPGSAAKERDSKPIVIEAAPTSDEPSRTPWLAAGGLLFAVVIGGFVIGMCSGHRLDLWVVNTSGDPISVYVDGDPVVRNLPSADAEAPSVVGHAQLASGPHAIDARASDGGMLESQRIEVRSDSPGYLFSPKHDAAHCFVVQETGYGANATPVPDVPLDTGRDLWELPTRIDRVLEPSPDSLKVKKGQGATDRALRLTECQRAPAAAPAPEPEPTTAP